jgi:hypothetical protein
MAADAQFLPAQGLCKSHSSCAARRPLAVPHSGDVGAALSFIIADIYASKSERRI